MNFFDRERRKGTEKRERVRESESEKEHLVAEQVSDVTLPELDHRWAVIHTRDKHQAIDLVQIYSLAMGDTYLITTQAR